MSGEYPHGRIPARDDFTPTLQFSCRFSSGDDCTLAFDLSKPGIAHITVTAFPQTAENWREFQAWTGGVVAQAVEACTPEQLLALVDQAAHLLRRLSGNDPTP